MTNKAESFCVVGGGMLGMTLAYRLRQQGMRVTLIEAASALGGLTSAWQIGDLVWDRYYHVTLLSDRFNRAILKELKLDDEMRWVTTRTGCYANGKLHSISNALEFLRFPALNLVDKARLAWTILYASRIRDWERLESVGIEEWLRRVSGDGTYEKFWRPLLKCKLGSCYQDVSAAFIWATIQRLYAARKSGLKEEMFGYLPGGYARVLAKYADVLRKSGVEILLDTRVENVSSGANEVDIRCSDGRTIQAAQVAVTAPAPLASGICTELQPAEHEKLKNTRYMGVLCASLVLRSKLNGFYVTNLTDDSFPFTGIIEMSALVDVHELVGHGLVYLPRYIDPDDDYITASDETVRAEFLRGLFRVYPQVKDEDVIAFRIARSKYVMPIPVIGYSKNVLPFQTSCKGVWLVNSSQIVNGTLNVNETVSLAERASKEILAR